MSRLLLLDFTVHSMLCLSGFVRTSIKRCHGLKMTMVLLIWLFAQSASHAV